MITKAIVLGKRKDTNKVSIYIPLFDTPGVNQSKNLSAAYQDATVSYQPGVRNTYRKDDKVFITFEEDDLTKPIIIGKLLLTSPKDKDIVLDASSLEIKDKAILPEDITLGRINLQKIYDTITEVQIMKENQTNNSSEGGESISPKHIIELGTSSTPSSTLKEGGLFFSPITYD